MLVELRNTSQGVQAGIDYALGFVNRLVKKEYLQRERSERIIVIQLTDKGKNKMTKVKL